MTGPDARAPAPARERMARLLYDAKRKWLVDTYGDDYGYRPTWDEELNTVHAEVRYAMADAVLAAVDKANAERDQDMFVNLRSDLAAATTQRAQAEARVTEMEELASSLACTRYEALAVMEQRAEHAEQQVRTLTTMWGAVHRALGLPAAEGVSADLVVGRLRAATERAAALERAAPLCPEHQPSTGTRSGCLVCALMELSAALSRIDYLCGEPNEYEVSGYDVHAMPQAVVEHVVGRLRAAEDRVGALTAMLDELQWNTACGGSHCKKCRQWEKQMDDVSGWGHTADCPLAALLTPPTPRAEP